MRFRISAVTASLFVIATMFPIAGQPQSGDESAIRSVIAAYADARQRGDGAAQAKFYADDADEWRSSARNMVVGRADIARDLTLAPSVARKFALHVESVKLITPVVAVVETVFSGSDPRPKGHASYVMVKRDGTWLIRSGRIFRYQEAPSTRLNTRPSAASLGDDPATFDQQIDNAFLHRDVGFIKAVVADDSLFTHNGGLAWNKQQWLGAVSAYEGRARDVDSIVVERHGDMVETVGHIRKVFVDPKRQEQQIYFVRLYARRGAEWQFLSHRTVKELTGPVSTR
jgi:uncharacterized protein (TIGR02246 family)